MGNPVVHWELLSKDPAKVSAFYAELFGWKILHRPELNYRIVETGGAGGINGGIMRPECEGEWPGNMTMYVLVDDLAAYRKRIARRRREDPHRGAGGARHGLALALHRPRWPHDGVVESQTVSARAKEIAWDISMDS